MNSPAPSGHEIKSNILIFSDFIISCLFTDINIS